MCRHGRVLHIVDTWTRLVGMEKIDFKKTLRYLYQPTAKDFSLIEVPAMQFVMTDGSGSPAGGDYADAMSWLYPVAYSVKFASKLDLGRDYTVMPLEGLWWAEDMDAFATDDKDAWLWTAMIMHPDWIPEDMFQAAVTKSADKLGDPRRSLRMETVSEGLSVQIMHIGPFADEAPTIARLRQVYLPEHGLTENGHHHEIYLSDPRRTAPEKLKTVIRQPVKRTYGPSN